MKLFPTVSAVAAAVVLCGLPASATILASTAQLAEAKSAKAKRSAHCVEHKLDVRSGMMITRYGCTTPTQGRWRDVAKVAFGAAVR